MSQSSANEHDEQDKQQLEHLRELILGNDRQLVTETIRHQARGLVADVVAEALHDRQKQDGSINKVLQPIVEHSVEKSVSSHSEKLVGYLYPLVGSLVRKAVSAFLTDFIEKTNQLLENSLTVRGLKWRFKAWQAGVSFAQYVASQTFIYRVEHLLLIHRKTGLLLKSVDYHQHSRGDADLISSMLGAINDFISDSFAPGEEGQEEQLQKISTDNFTLLIKPGPMALVVAAVTGNAPQSVTDQMQITLEDIHRLYADDLQRFNGDASVFEHAESQLQDCLLAEQKAEHFDHQKRFPWKAWLLVFIVALLVGKGLYGQWQQSQLAQHLRQIDLQPGIIVNKIDIQDPHNIKMDLMRDPAAISVPQWLTEQGLDYLHIELNERGFISQDAELLHAKVAKLLSDYNDIIFQWHGSQLQLSGQIDITEREDLLTRLAILGYVRGSNLQLTDVVFSHPQSGTNTELVSQMFTRLVGQISATQLHFEVASSAITAPMRAKLQVLAERFGRLQLLATQLNYHIDGLVIVGSSDNSGRAITNDQLSQLRANHTLDELTKLGIAQRNLLATGLGEVDLGNDGSTARKVMFNVMYSHNTDDSSLGQAQ